MKFLTTLTMFCAMLMFSAVGCTQPSDTETTPPAGEAETDTGAAGEGEGAGMGDMDEGGADTGAAEEGSAEQ